MTAFVQAFLLLFFSEMGDKTQIVSFAFGAQYPIRVVLTGIFIAILGLMAFSVAVGNVLGAFVPQLWINIFSAILFIIFGILTLRETDEEVEEVKSEEEQTTKSRKPKLGPLAAVVTTFFFAELGDKTIFAAMAVGCSQHNYPMVLAGSTLGMFCSDLIAVLFGRVLGKRLPANQVRLVSALILVGAGLWTLGTTFVNH